ncbi:adenylosuccinate lyase [Candidatus Woesearchaeota archaeon]|nr:MAG: adenylosuccinate lyase [Candidatus Woesearchaeota archaeon]
MKADIFDMVSPLDYRYYGRNSDAFGKLKDYLSENAMIKYMAKVEAALTTTLSEMGLCSKKIAREVEQAAGKVTAEEVYKEEDRIKHNVRALANSIRKRVSKEAKPYVHFTSTSHDIICSAEAARFKDAMEKVIVPACVELEKTLIEIALREKRTLQIGRTHGQHAEPITFGFTMAEYVDRFGNRILAMKKAASELRGKLSGAVGAYNASSLFFKNPYEFEKKVLSKLGIKPAMHSTQVAEPEFMADLLHSVVSAFGVLANLADDMRHLQRSEIAEVGEAFGKQQVGSSTMPHKRNPINFENVKSMFKAFMPKMITAYLDQISEHQRDLTNSASQRFNAELLVAFYVSVRRLKKVLDNLVVDRRNLQKNFDMSSSLIVAEPLYILLAAHGHPDAHEHVRRLAQSAREQNKPLEELIAKDASLKKYLAKMTAAQRKVLTDPQLYIGRAVQTTERVCRHWKKTLRI